MSSNKPDCSRHSKQVGGFTDMKLLAEAIGDLHYETLSKLFYHLGDKLAMDAHGDLLEGRKKLGQKLHCAYLAAKILYFQIDGAWQISKLFMDKPNT